MKRFVLFAALAALSVPGLSMAQSVQTQTVKLEGSLAGDNENPPVDTTVAADVTVTMEFMGSFEDDSVFEDVGEAFADGFNNVVDFFTGDDDSDANPPEDIENVEKVTVRMRADLSGINGQTFTGGHIHRGKTGENGPIVVDLEVGQSSPSAGNTTMMTTVMLTTEMEIETAFNIVANPENYYVNLHTTANPSGELRAQLSVSSDTQVDRLSRQISMLQQDITALTSAIQNLASQERLDQLNRIDENVANIGRRVGLNTHSQQVVGSAN